MIDVTNKFYLRFNVKDGTACVVFFEDKKLTKYFEGSDCYLCSDGKIYKDTGSNFKPINGENYTVIRKPIFQI